MESLLNRLSESSSAEEVGDALLHARAAVGNIVSSPDLKKFESTLVQHCCQNNNLSHWEHDSEKKTRWDNLERLHAILLELCEIRRQSRTRIIDGLLSHVELHPSCYICLSLTFKMMTRSSEVLQYVRKQRFLRLAALLQTVAMHTADARELRQVQDLRNRQRSSSNLYELIENELATVARPAEYQEAQSTELTSKIPPLLLPTSKSISSSRYSFGSKDDRHRALDELFKLGSDIGESSIGVELGCLLAKRRISQVNRFSESPLYGKGGVLEQNQTERDLSARGLACEDIESIILSNQDEQLRGKHLRKSLVVLANMILKCAQKDYEQDDLSTSDVWLPSIFELLFSGVVHHYDSDSLRPKGFQPELCLALQGILLPKETVFGRLLGVSALQSQNIQLIASFTKNVSPMSLNNNRDSLTEEISDSLLGKVSIERARINRRLLAKVGVTSFDRSTMRALQSSSSRLLIKSDKFVVMMKDAMERVLEQFDTNRPRSYTMLTRLLEMLDNYLKHSESKINSFECIELLMENLLLVKRIVLELSIPFLRNAQEEKQESTLKNTGKFSKKTRLELSRILARPLCYEHPRLVSTYLSVLSGFLSSQKSVEKLFMNVFLKNAAFLELVEAHTKRLFLDDEHQQLLKVLRFYRKFVQVYHLRRLRNQDNKPAKTMMDSLQYLFNVRNGLITTYLRESDKTIAQLLEPASIQDPRTISRISFMRELLGFVQELYNYSPDLNPLLEDDVSSFYIKFAFINFVKLYSFLTVSELETIRQLYESSDCKSPQLVRNPNGYYKQNLMVAFLDILTNLSINRTDEISKKMRQYRILEFFTRELQLEFCIRDYKHKLVKTDKPKSTDKKVDRSTEKSKKPIVPSLALKGHSKTTEEDPEENKPTRKAIPPVKIPERHMVTEGQGHRHKEGYLDGLMGEITKEQSKPKSPLVPAIKLMKTEQTKTKPQLALNLHNIDQLKEQARKPEDDKLIYTRERRIRKIYSGRTMHSSAVLLVLSLLLKRGLLDPLYCDQYPIMNGKINVLYILHHHLNHEANYSILSHLTEGVSRIKPYPAGQRLLKLLASPFTNMSLYSEWEKMSEGGYGTIFSCKTNLANPNEVAIKQMNLPESIYERCVLNDIFTEISCLENFRLDPKVTDIYDYGVTDNSYVIVMKRYRFSLRHWRRSQKEANLPVLLGIFRQILKIVKLLHENMVTHYDIKADNILLDCDSEEAIEQGRYTVVFGDFGECKIYQSETDQLDLRPRGTECNKSPEMLTVSSKSKKDSENYDRRRKVGTNKASDIWSLGCLFYELLTGEYLFDASMWTVFFLHVTSDKKELLGENESVGLDRNIYLIDFLKFILVREPQHRPSIDSIIRRFENIYGLLVPNSELQVSNNPLPLQFQQTLDNLIEEYLQLMLRSNPPAPKIDRRKFGGLLKIMEDIYFCEQDFYHSSRSQIVKEGISHVIATFPVKKFLSLVIRPSGENIMTMPLRVAARISDFLREVLIFKGKLLFVNDNSNYAIVLLVYCLSLWFRCTIFETWCLINTQILEFPMSSGYLPLLSQALNRLNKIQEHIEDLPKLQCICGSVTLILKRSINDNSHKVQVRSCKCKRRGNGEQECFTSGCQAYLDFIKKRFNIEWEHMKWNFMATSNFLIGPQCSGKIQDPMKTQIVINSAEPSQNMTQVDPSHKSDWRVFKCKVCEMWMIALGQDRKAWVLMNNLIKTIRQGILIPNAQQNYRIRTPVLNNFTLSKLHMISQ